MEIWFDKYHRPVPSKLYLGSVNLRPICPIAGVDEKTFSLTKKVNNTYEISFTVSRYLDRDGKLIANGCYDFIDTLLRVYVTGTGWFIINPPQIENDGLQEIKRITAESAEIEMQQHDISGLKVNMGTTDSYEMLVDGNVETIDEVEFAKEQIRFCNKQKPELSFLHILLKVSGLYGWTIDYIDSVPKRYEYYEDGVKKYKYVLLSDEIGRFDIDKQDLYSLLTQTAAQFFGCLFVFDFKNLTISAYRPENYGKNTNINIGFRNIQDSNQISIDENNLFTRYRVYGGEGLNINYVNFGTNLIEDLSYFLSEKYMPIELINKYHLWQEDVESKRLTYMEYTRKYNEQQKVIRELYDRLPLDGCSTDWSTFTDAELKLAEDNYKAQKTGYEKLYVDEWGEFDEEALKASSDADDYYQIKDVILPSIQIEWENRNLPTEDEIQDYIDSYKTNWKLYGLDELDVKLASYKNTIAVCQKGGYDTPYEEGNGHTEDYHNSMYEKYQEAVKQLDGTNHDSCQYAYDTRKQEIDAAKSVAEQYDDIRQGIVKNVTKETWIHSDISFTQEELNILSKYYIDNDYSNENMFLTSSDDAVSAIDEQLKLLQVAQEDLSIASQPQYTYTTKLDNFLALYDFRNYTNNFDVGDFIWLGVRDDYVVKLRAESLTYNPLVMDNELQFTFTNMLRSRSKRDDLTYLLGTTSNRGKNVVNGGSGNTTANEGIELTPGLIQKLVSSALFGEKIYQMIEDGIAIGGGHFTVNSDGSLSLTLEELNAKLIQVVDLYAENGFFEYLQSKLITADKIVADSGTFGTLSSKVGQIDSLLSGTISTELGHIIHLTAQTVSIDEAVIRELIAAQMTVDMLNAGTISADKFHIASDDGGFELVGNTMQFKDSNNVVRIQIGRDETNNFTFVLYDEAGEGVLIDSTGIKSSAISDGLIQTDMVANGAITEDKIDKTDIHEWTDNDGNKVFDISNFYYGEDKFEVSYNTIKSQVNSLSNVVSSVELVGKQVFIESDGIISPSSITLTTKLKGNAEISKWYIDDVENTVYISPDKKSITLPSSLMSNKKNITIKVECTDTDKYDIMSVYKVVDGSDAYSVVATSSNGTLFKEEMSTVCTCNVYKGSTIIEPRTYSWVYVNENDNTWTELGTTKTITLPLLSTIVRKRVKCLVDV